MFPSSPKDSPANNERFPYTKGEIHTYVGLSLTYQAEENFQPKVVQAVHPVLLVEVDEPSPSIHVGPVLPHRLDSCLEHAVIAPSDEPR